MRVTPFTCESDKVPIAPLRVRIRGDSCAYEYGNEAAEKDHAHCDAQAHGVVAPWVLDVPGKGGSTVHKQQSKQASEQARNQASKQESKQSINQASKGWDKLNVS